MHYKPSLSLFGTFAALSALVLVTALLVTFGALGGAFATTTTTATSGSVAAAAAGGGVTAEEENHHEDDDNGDEGDADAHPEDTAVLHLLLIGGRQSVGGVGLRLVAS